MKRKHDLIIFAIFAALVVGIMLGAKGQQAIHSRNCPVAPVTLTNILASKDYQIQCSIDSVYVFDNNRLIGATLWGKDGIDSLILKDNE